MPDEPPRSVSSVIFTIYSYTGTLSTDGSTNSVLSFTDSLHAWSDMVQTVCKGYQHTGQCKRTGGCYNELVVAFYSTGGGVKGKKIYTC